MRLEVEVGSRGTNLKRNADGLLFRSIRVSALSGVCSVSLLPRQQGSLPCKGVSRNARTSSSSFFSFFVVKSISIQLQLLKTAGIITRIIVRRLARRRRRPAHGNDGQKDRNKGTGSAVRSTADGHIGGHMVRLIVLLLYRMIAPKLRYDSDPAWDRTGHDTAGHHRNGDLLREGLELAGSGLMEASLYKAGICIRRAVAERMV